MQETTIGKDIIFYDGHCGLCHGFVRWVLAHDPEGRFHLAPLHGETVTQRISAEERAKLPDSVVVLTGSGGLFTKSAAAEYVAECLGLQKTAAVLRISPRGLADFGYDIIARARYSLFGRKEGDMCPVVPPELRDRFLP